MPRRIRTDDRDDAADRADETDPELYIPAAGGPAPVTSRLTRVWETLFNHQVGPRR